SRREFLGTAAVAGAAALTGSLARDRHAQAQGRVLNMLTWPGHGDQEFVGPFEKQYGVTVKVKEYVGGEQMLAAVNSAPPGTYDGVLTDREYIPQLLAADKIVPLNPADYPFNDYFPEFRNLPNHWINGKLYSVLLRIMYQGIAHNTEKISN